MRKAGALQQAGMAARLEGANRMARDAIGKEGCRDPEKAGADEHGLQHRLPKLGKLEMFEHVEQLGRRDRLGRLNADSYRPCSPAAPKAFKPRPAAPRPPDVVLSDRSATSLAGLTFVFTGALERFTRSEARLHSESLGGGASAGGAGLCRRRAGVRPTARCLSLCHQRLQGA